MVGPRASGDEHAALRGGDRADARDVAHSRRGGRGGPLGGPTGRRGSRDAGGRMASRSGGGMTERMFEVRLIPDSGHQIYFVPIAVPQGYADVAEAMEYRKSN